MAATSVAEPLHVLAQPRADRLRMAVGRWAIGGVFAWVATVGVLQFWALPQWTNRRRADLAAALAAPVALLGACRSYMRRYHTVVVYPDAIELRRVSISKRVRSSDVLALVGDGGINLDGGDLIAWKRLAILTAEDRHVLEFHREDNAAIYRALHGACPRAWGLRYPARLEPRGPPGQKGGGAASRVGLGLIDRFMRRRIISKAALGMVLFVASLAIAAVLVSRSLADAESGKGLIFLVVGMVIGLMSIADAVRGLRVLRTIRRWKWRRSGAATAEDRPPGAVTRP